MSDTATTTPEIQLCGHSDCEDYRRNTIGVTENARWCPLGHQKGIRLTSEDWSTIMSGLASSAREATEQGHKNIAISRWEALTAIESALGLESDAATTLQTILAVELL